MQPQSVMKVLDFLITFQLFDYPLTEIAKNSEVSYSTLQTFWGNLEKNNIVVKTRRVGKSDLYKLNKRLDDPHHSIFGFKNKIGTSSRNFNDSNYRLILNISIAPNTVVLENPWMDNMLTYDITINLT